MTDTPQHIKEMQLKIWLAKPPMERLKQMMEDNAALAHFWKNARPTDTAATNEDPNEKPEGQRALCGD